VGFGVVAVCREGFCWCGEGWGGVCGGVEASCNYRKLDIPLNVMTQINLTQKQTRKPLKKPTFAII
jgi:hypothetical protein